MQKLNLPLKISLFILTLVLVFYSIIQARNFLYPLAFGLLISYLLFPVVNFLEHHKFPRILAILVTILSSVILLAAAFFLFYKQLAVMFDDFDSIKQKANQNIEVFQQYLNKNFGVNDNGLEKFLKKQGQNLFGNETAN